MESAFDMPGLRGGAADLFRAAAMLAQGERLLSFGFKCASSCNKQIPANCSLIVISLCGTASVW